MSGAIAVGHLSGNPLATTLVVATIFIIPSPHLANINLVRPNVQNKSLAGLGTLAHHLKQSADLNPIPNLAEKVTKF